MSGISKRVSGTWQNTSYGIRATATDTITTLPTTIYGDGTNATVSIKGNTVQSGTPTPDNPVMPEGCGDLESTGEYVGQYKIPISSASTTTPVYLGEVQTTRKIKKLVLTGEETWTRDTRNNLSRFATSLDIIAGENEHGYCSHYVYQYINIDNTVYVGGTFQFMYILDNRFDNTDDFKTFLQQQYAANTPVTIWYVLAEPETGIVNEPLMMIDHYADEVSSISIPTTDGATTLSVDTTVQPSEITATYQGWHIGTVHERISGQWD